MAAVRDRVRRADGSILASGFQFGQQLETAKKQSANYSDRRGIDENKCKRLHYNRQTSGRHSARVPSDQRLLRNESRARRHSRLRARIQLLPQMPNPAPIHLSGEEVSQNITNSGTGRTDGQRAAPKRTASADWRKVAFSSSEGTTQFLLLGDITTNASGRGPALRRGLAIVSSFVGYPPPPFLFGKKTSRLQLRFRRTFPIAQRRHGKDSYVLVNG